MASRAREAVAPVYLLACLLAGGSAQGVWGNMALQLAGLAILAWAAADRSNRTMPAAARQLFILAAVAVAVVALQLVPLPASVWTRLGGREDVARGFEVLGLEKPSLPASLTPYASLGLAACPDLPPLAMFAAIVRLRAYRTAWLIAALLLGTIAGIVLGVLQLSSSDYSALPWYLYPTSSFGVATGFFANGNHMAILLVVTLPFLATLLASPHGSNRELNAAICDAFPDNRNRRAHWNRAEPHCGRNRACFPGACGKRIDRAAFAKLLAANSACRRGSAARGRDRRTRHEFNNRCAAGPRRGGVGAQPPGNASDQHSDDAGLYASWLRLRLVPAGLPALRAA